MSETSMAENETLLDSIEEWLKLPGEKWSPRQQAVALVEFMEKAGWHFVDDLGHAIIDSYGNQDHVIAFSNNGWHIEHPIECRAAGLDKCPYLAQAQEQFDGKWWIDFGGLVRGTKQNAVINGGEIELFYKERLT